MNHCWLLGGWRSIDGRVVFGLGSRRVRDVLCLVLQQQSESLAVWRCSGIISGLLQDGTHLMDAVVARPLGQRAGCELEIGGRHKRGGGKVKA